MKLSDERVIEFFSKSPIKTFSGMLNALRYLDGQWTHQENDYALFDDALGDNTKEKIRIRVPHVGGIAATALLAFSWHAQAFNLIRRRSMTIFTPGNKPEEIIVFYELTTSGANVVKVLEVLTDVTNSKNASTQFSC